MIHEFKFDEKDWQIPTRHTGSDVVESCTHMCFQEAAFLQPFAEKNYDRPRLPPAV